MSRSATAMLTIKYCDIVLILRFLRAIIITALFPSREIVIANKYNVVRVKRFCGVYPSSFWHSDDRLSFSFESKGPVEMFVLKFMS